MTTCQTSWEGSPMSLRICKKLELRITPNSDRLHSSAMLSTASLVDISKSWSRATFEMSMYQIINTSTKGLWSESEHVTLVQPSSREAIIRAVLRGRDRFI